MTIRKKVVNYAEIKYKEREELSKKLTKKNCIQVIVIDESSITIKNNKAKLQFKSFK